MGDSASKPGWYPDPSGAAGQRYWDGNTWGPPAPPPTAPPAPPKRVPVGLIIIGTIILMCGGCGGLGLLGALGSDSKKDDSSSSSSVTSSPSSRFIPLPTTTPPPPADDTSDRVFFAQLSEYPWFNTVDRDDLIEKGHLVCTSTTSGGGDSAAKAQVLGKMIDAGFSLKNATGFMLASFTAYCPEHLALLR